jgi:dihydroxy-acid dehydratase
MEAGRLPFKKPLKRFDPVDTYIAAFNKSHMDIDLDELEHFACPTCGSCSGMFTANSMNCLAEALGLALPGNGSLLATHADRKTLFESAAAKIVELATRYYEHEDDSVLPLNIATLAAFENAMKVDIAMGGSTNTILHLLAMAQEAGVDFTIADIDRLSREVPHLCKVSPSSADYYMEDVHRAGGIMGILGELDRGKHIDTTVASIAGDNLGAVLEKWDCIRSQDVDVSYFYRAAPGGQRTIEPYSQTERWREMDLDRTNGCIRNIENAYSDEGGLAVLYGNISEKGCIVKTAAVPEPMHRFSGTARVFDQQDTALQAIDSGEIVAGTIIVIRYEGPKGGPGMQEMLKPTMSLIARGLADSCAMITDGRYSGASAGLSIGHVSPEAAGKGAIALIEDGDTIEIDLPNRSINLLIEEAVLASRRAKMDARPGGWQPQGARTRDVTKALKAYAAFAASADRGGYRDI